MALRILPPMTERHKKAGQRPLGRSRQVQRAVDPLGEVLVDALGGKGRHWVIGVFGTPMIFL